MTCHRHAAIIEECGKQSNAFNKSTSTSPTDLKSSTASHHFHKYQVVHAGNYSQGDKQKHWHDKSG